ncbi:glycoside hydrolase family 3 protein [Halorubrum amylolyticum]|uniref:glycoside hydrolase family 3 protein n=1 Tax=Halorubrum amylolyticum TaxID=2508724 RepID=UPI001008A78C|nr:glycoside hydrolase family 3 C-terminal domain-containing protein [Halorubrum amylolyticum]
MRERQASDIEEASVSNHSDTSDTDQTAASRRGLMKLIGTASAAAALGSGVASGNPDTSHDPDVDELVEQMTLEEKVGRTYAADRYIQGIDRLGVPGIRNVNGPAGASLADFIDGAETTEFPHTIAAAATFNPELINEQGRAIAREAKDGGASGLFGQSIDITRIPLHSRSGESFGEDPYLASALTESITNGLQSEGVIATLKHYCAYNQTRTTGDVEDYYSTSEHNVVVSERALREIYLPPFRAGVVEGGAGAIMTAYNRINGTYAAEHEDLLDDILKGEWGFDGYVISDYGGTHSSVRSAVNGLDVELVGDEPEYFGQNLQEAVENDELREGTVDEMVARTLHSQKEIGALSGDRIGSEPARNTEDHFAIAEQMAREGTVLLKNDDLLPLDTGQIDEIALVGPAPTEFKEDIGGSDGINESRRISPVEGLEAVTDDDTVITTVSSDRTELVTADDGFGYESYDEADFSGEPIETGTVSEIDYEGDASSITWTGEITPSITGTYGISFTSIGSGTVSVDGEQVVYTEGGGFGGPDTEVSAVSLAAGESYEIAVEVNGGGPVRLEWNPPTGIREAAEAAANADIAVVLTRTYTDYGDDRKQYALPDNQDALIESVIESNEDTAVLVNATSAVAMPWVNDVPAIMQLWFPGQEGGRALGDLLVGNANPSGKAPVTFAESIEDYLPQEVDTLPDSARGYPGVEGNVYYDEDVFVGYRHFDEAGIEPMFPFGHGESYTTFEYGRVKLSKALTTPEEGVTVSVEVTNTGETDGAEAVQVYLSDVDPAIERPPKELKGVEKLEISAGETKTAKIDLEEESFRYWSPDESDWAVTGGEYVVQVGSSSRDIREKRTLRLREDPPHRNQNESSGS